MTGRRETCLTFYADAFVTDFVSECRYAPSAGAFASAPTASQKEDIYARMSGIADQVTGGRDPAFLVAPRFVAHGIRGLVSHWQGYELSFGIRDELPAGIFLRRDISRGHAGVHVDETDIKQFIELGLCGVEDPFSMSKLHLHGVQESGLWSIEDYDVDKKAFRATLDGDLAMLFAGSVSWIVGTEHSVLKGSGDIEHYHAGGGIAHGNPLGFGGSVARNSFSGSVRLSRGDFALNWNICQRGSARNLYETGTFPRWTGHDLTFSWTIPLGAKGPILNFGVLNLADKGPTADSSYAGSVITQSDSVRGRTFFAGVTTRF